MSNKVFVANVGLFWNTPCTLVTIQKMKLTILETKGAETITHNKIMNSAHYNN
jgi:transcription elongation factor